MTAVDVSAIGRSNVERPTPDVQSKRAIGTDSIQRFSYDFASGAGVFLTNARGRVAFTILKARINSELATASLRLEWRYRFAHRIPNTRDLFTPYPGKGLCRLR